MNVYSAGQLVNMGHTCFSLCCQHEQPSEKAALRLVCLLLCAGPNCSRVLGQIAAGCWAKLQQGAGPNGSRVLGQFAAGCWAKLQQGAGPNCSRVQM